MADTLPDITIPTGSWLDLYTASGITQGTSIEVTNKSPVNILIQEAASQPSSDDINGKPIFPVGHPNSTVICTSISNSLWVKSVDTRSGKVNVEEV